MVDDLDTRHANTLHIVQRKTFLLGAMLMWCFYHIITKITSYLNEFLFFYWKTWIDSLHGASVFLLHKKTLVPCKERMFPLILPGLSSLIRRDICDGAGEGWADLGGPRPCEGLLYTPRDSSTGPGSPNDVVESMLLLRRWWSWVMTSVCATSGGGGRPWTVTRGGGGARQDGWQHQNTNIKIPTSKYQYQNANRSYTTIKNMLY